VSGGKFSNGAVTAAFSRAFNDEHLRVKRPFTSINDTPETLWDRSFGSNGRQIIKIDQYGDPQWHDLQGVGQLVDKVLGSRLYLDVDVQLTKYGEYEQWEQFTVTTKTHVTLHGNFNYESTVLKIGPKVLTGKTEWRANGIVTDTNVTGIRACPFTCGP
jgi:hypothetical protein